METTIKLKPATKEALRREGKPSETYDEIVQRALAHLRAERLDEELEEGYRSRLIETKELARDWDAIDPPWPQ